MNLPVWSVKPVGSKAVTVSPVVVNAQWQGKLKIIRQTIGLVHVEGKLVENIPGLHMGSGEVIGSWDALEVYRQRGGSAFKLPLQLNKGLTRFTHPKLHAYQCAGVAFILHRWQHAGSCILADDMGLGKTAQAITACDAVGIDGIILVVCPASVRLTWEKEITRWSRAPDVQVLKKGTDILRAGVRWVVTSYELMRDMDPIYASIVIMDEAHNFAGRHAKRAKKLQNTAACAQYRIAITGTPIWSRPRDYWMLFNILFGRTFGSSWDFDMAYCGGKLNDHGGLENKGATRTNELKFRTSFYQLRRLKADVAKELPALTRQILWVEPTPKATAEMKHAILHRNKGATYEALSAALDGKMQAAMEQAAQAKQFLLFTWQKRHARFMQEKLEEAGTPCVLITGDTSQNERRSLVELAVAQKCGVVATIDSCGTGVDGLQHVANIGIFHSTDFVPLKLLQAEKRLDRLGQTQPVQWLYIMMRESMDQWVGELVVEKLAQYTSLMGKDEADVLRSALVGRDANITVEQAETNALRALYGEK